MTKNKWILPYVYDNIQVIWLCFAVVKRHTCVAIKCTLRSIFISHLICFSLYKIGKLVCLFFYWIFSLTNNWLKFDTRCDLTWRPSHDNNQNHLLSEPYRFQPQPQPQPQPQHASNIGYHRSNPYTTEYNPAQLFKR